MQLISELAPLTVTAEFPALPSGGRWRNLLSCGMSAALLIAIIMQFQHIGIARLWRAAPASPMFWAGLAAYYLALPASEWVIFHRLWKLPAAGFAALLRKLVSNEVLLGYSGELSFYAWARRHGALTAAPFGAIKDVSILSAFAGNLATLAMTALAWPFLGLLNIGTLSHAILISTVVIIAVAVLMALFGRRVFSLPARELRFVFSVHLLRLLATTLLSGLIWHAALPGIGLDMWILLAALQLLVTRLPLVPNKDLVFASLSFALIGHDARISVLLAMVAALILLTHLLVGGVLALVELQPKRGR